MELPPRRSFNRLSVPTRIQEPPTLSVAPGPLPEQAPVLGSSELQRFFAEPRFAEGEVLGRGGMGEVHLVTDTRLGRQVACKRLRRDRKEEPGLTLRLLREAVIQGQLEHPAIVPVYDLMLGAQGPQFLMRRVEGWSLSEVLRGEYDGDPEQVSLSRLLAGFSSVCLAVDFAHQRGVWHRDIKPDNIMLGGFGEVYLLDWGVACMSAEVGERWESRRISGRQGPTGTPGYIAPEVLAGEQTLDSRADIYALGAVLFEILTSQRLHQGNAAERLDSTLRPAPGPLERGFPVAPELDEICRKATAFHREERYSNARALANAITRYLDALQGEQLRIQLAGDSARRGEELQREARRSPAAAAAATQELSHALRLDPSNARAARSLEELLGDLPEVFPEQAEEAFEQEQGARRGVSPVLDALRWLAPLSVALWVASSSTLSWSWRAAGGGLSLLAAGASALWSRGRERRLRLLGASLFFVAFHGVLVVAAGAFGPFLLVPVLRLLLGITMILGGYPRHGLIIGTSVASLGLTYGLAELGIFPLPPLQDIAGGGILGSGYLSIALTQGGLLVATLLLVARFQERQRRSERRLFWQAWQLRPRGVAP